MVGDGFDRVLVRTFVDLRFVVSDGDFEVTVAVGGADERVFGLPDAFRGVIGVGKFFCQGGDAVRSCNDVLVGNEGTGTDGLVGVVVRARQTQCDDSLVRDTCIFLAVDLVVLDRAKFTSRLSID